LRRKAGETMAKEKNISVYLCFLLRHHPEEANLDMDRHGWVSVKQLVDNINRVGKYQLTVQQSKQIVETDNKGRYRFNVDETWIRVCQGHSIPWVQPELQYFSPPEFLYHGTTCSAWRKIRKSGAIRKMNRHAVHMQADEEKAWQSANRWHQDAVVLKIAAQKMSQDGIMFGVSDNDVWCTEQVDVRYVCQVLE
jgi:putative RNA 2'-phosphotransferase